MSFFSLLFLSVYFDKDELRTWYVDVHDDVSVLDDESCGEKSTEPCKKIETAMKKMKMAKS